MVCDGAVQYCGMYACDRDFKSLYILGCNFYWVATCLWGFVWVFFGECMVGHVSVCVCMCGLFQGFCLLGWLSHVNTSL